MDKIFNSYWLIRLTALLFAVALFVYVKAEMKSDVQSTNTQQTDIINNVELEAYYDNENLVVSGLPKTVDVAISGPNATVMRTKMSKDYKIFVDLSTLLIGEHTVTIQAENFSDKLDVSVDPKTVTITIEEKVTQEFQVEPEMNTSQIAADHVLKSMDIEPKTVYVTGSESAINNVSYVKATVEAEEKVKKSFEQEANVKVLDRDLNKLDVSIDPEIVKVGVQIEEYSASMPVVIKQKGSLQEGVTLNTLTADPDNIKVYGPKAIVDAMEEFAVEVDVSKIDKSGTYETEVKVPEGASKISVKKVKVEADVTKAELENRDEQPTSDSSEESSEPSPIENSVEGSSTR